MTARDHSNDRPNVTWGIPWQRGETDRRARRSGDPWCAWPGCLHRAERADRDRDNGPYCPIHREEGA